MAYVEVQPANLRCAFLLLLHSVSATLPTGQLSNVPWRRSGVKYTNNEAYFDVTEEVDAIIDKAGGTVTAEIQGYVS
ncbi:AP-3 complex subunit mu-1 [Portunus trituberculatus]|uniref:AP-3 complex subunit mu-1 n=1 Tax=Portunus trituberculatus TaxID=210409 RepID=A0A5B7IDM4_PORTR|nr:AP-3 complex subunit mu-1 [Portunus trituberculatus]